MKHACARWLITFAVAAGLAMTTAHAAVKELAAKQSKQSIELDYTSTTAATPGKSPDCSGPALTGNLNCVTTRMDGPQGGTAAESDDALARVPVTPVLKEDDGGGERTVFVELTAETGSIGNVGAFPSDVQIKLRRDLFLAKDLLSKFRHTLSEKERKQLLIDQKPLTITVRNGWDRLTLLKLVKGTVTVAPPKISFKTALGAAEGWLP